MPAVLPITEMQRNGAKLAERAIETKEPIYLTKHGKSSLVLIDAEEFDRRMSYREAIVNREQERYAGIMRGHDEVLQGKVVPLDEALDELRDRWDS